MKLGKLFTFGGVIIFLILSCSKHDNTPKKVYFNLALGASKFNADRFYEVFRHENSGDNISRYPFYKHFVGNNHNYYSSPLYLYPPNDSVVYMIEIYSCLDRKDGDEIIDNARMRRQRMSFENKSSSISSQDVYSDVFKEVSLKYGKPNTTDTVNLKETSYILSNWKNKEGINISLKYTFVTYNYQEDLMNYYSLKLEFSLTDELYSKLVKNKSIY